MTTHSPRARAALIRLADADPALGALALWVQHRDGAGRAAAAWTDGRTVFYGPAFEVLAPHEQTGLAAHQVLHVAFRHPARMAGMAARLGPGFDADTFNLACEAILNETLTRAGHALPRPAVLLPDLLRAVLPEETAVTGWDAERLYLRLMQRVAGRQGDTGAGQGGRGATAAYAQAAGFSPDLDPTEARATAPQEDAVQAADWHDRVTRALEAGRMAGRGIGALDVAQLDLPPSTVPWERALRGLVARALAVATRPDWGRPSRRWLAADALARRTGAPEPAFHPGWTPPPGRLRIAVAIDCSSSVDTACLGLFATQIAGIGRRSGAEVHVIVFDTEVITTRQMRGARWEGEIRALRFRRGGGTDFAPALREAAALSPSAIVVLTDLDGPTGPAPGRIPVIWATPDTPAHRPGFGRVISLAR